MASVAVLRESTSTNSMDDPDVPLSALELASAEIEQIRVKRNNACPTTSPRETYRHFPPACLAMLKDLDGNDRCVDCGVRNPEWAAVSYGALLCLQCSGHHRSLGVNVSCVRSINMDEWSPEEVLCMLEGGNSQLEGFFNRHALSVKSCRSPSSPKQPSNKTASATNQINEETVTRVRYKTKAARFYREQMEAHVAKILATGPYRGREISRRGNYGGKQPP